MRNLISLAHFISTAAIALTASALPVSAQSGTPRDRAPQLLGSGQHVTGGFGSIDARVTRLDGSRVILTGAHGGWLIGNQLSIGGAAWWNMTPRANTSFTLPSGVRTGLGFGYAGLELGWTGQPESLVHVTASALLGGGALQFYEVGGKREDFERTPSDAFVVAEPALGLEVNVSRHIRLGATASYRAMYGVTQQTLSDRKLSGPSGGVTLKFGKF